MNIPASIRALAQTAIAAMPGAPRVLIINALSVNMRRNDRPCISACGVPKLRIRGKRARFPAFNFVKRKDRCFDKRYGSSIKALEL